MNDIFDNEWDNTNDDVTIEEVEIDDLPEDDLPMDMPEDLPSDEPVKEESPKVVDMTPVIPKKAETPKAASPKKESKPKELNPYEKVILAEMQRRATSDALLAKGLADTEKSIQDCFKYVYEQARKIKSGNVAMVEDSKVYGWAVHYYTEPKAVIDAELRPKVEKKAEDKKSAPAKPNKNPIFVASNNKGTQAKTGDPKTNVVSKKDKNGNVVDITEFLLF